jgi:3-methyladenine DNA glycosylase AlkD
MDYNAEIRGIQHLIDATSNEQTRQWWEKYMRHSLGFRGASMGNIRLCIHQWYTTREISPDTDEVTHLALLLIRQPLAEDKLAGILILHEIVLRHYCSDAQTLCNEIYELFESGNVFDWNTCDWLCMKVLSRIVIINNNPAQAISVMNWVNSPNPWLQRAAMISFVPLAKTGEANYPGFTRSMLQTVATAIVNPHRFVQTGCGWILRETWIADPVAVESFISSKIEFFSSEGLRYAIEKMPHDKQMNFLMMKKQRKISTHTSQLASEA